MKHTLSRRDNQFKEQVEQGTYLLHDFNHRAHVQLAYVYLVESNNNVSLACENTKNAICGLLKSYNLDPSNKYHETLTKAWLLVVAHFMEVTPSCSSSDELLTLRPKL